MAPKIGVYVHIPFCRSKCLYCDFTSFAGQENNMEAYTNALLREIKNSSVLQNNEIQTIFIGGGTPTVLPPVFLRAIVEALTAYKISTDVEITVEANPGTLDHDMLAMLKSTGVNRLSMGLQAVQNVLLRKIGRIHSHEEFLLQYNRAVQIGFKNINIDVMFGLPQQSLADWQQTLDVVTGLQPSHISAYGLLVEEDTVFGEMERAGTLDVVSEETDRRMYHTAKVMLRAKGYAQYEISNFAREGAASRHNILYWKRGTYIGFGVAAHSFVDGARFFNTDNMAAYIQNPTNAEAGREVVSHKAAMEEFMFLGLRMVEGVDAILFLRCFGMTIDEVYGTILTQMYAQKLLARAGAKISLTENGVDVSNYVLSKFLL